jgi:hypothetical protein
MTSATGPSPAAGNAGEAAAFLRKSARREDADGPKGEGPTLAPGYAAGGES